MTHKSLFSKQFTTNHSMTNIMLVTHTQNTGSMTPTNTYIVEHSRLLDKLLIEIQFRMLSASLQTLVSHLSRVFQ